MNWLQRHVCDDAGYHDAWDTWLVWWETYGLASVAAERERLATARKQWQQSAIQAKAILCVENVQCNAALTSCSKVEYFNLH